MAEGRPRITVRTGFSHAAVEFEVRVANTTSQPIRNIAVRPAPVPEGASLDRARHRITLLPPRQQRVVQFRLRPRPRDRVVAVDITVDWDSPGSEGRGRFTTSSPPADLGLPSLRAPSASGETWHSSIRMGVAVEVRLRHGSAVAEAVRAMELAASHGLPGETTSSIEEGPTGPLGTVHVRAEGARGLRAGLLAEVRQSGGQDGSRVLLVVSATSDELLTRFYLACVAALGEALPELEGKVPVSLLEEP